MLTWVKMILFDWLIYMAERDLVKPEQAVVYTQRHEFDSFLKYSFLEIAKKEWLIWIIGGALAFMGASLFMSGWPEGLVPDIHRPFTYSGDGISYMWNIKRVMEEAWYFTNNNSGYPFGSNHLDYPTSDTGNYLTLKLLASALSSPVAVLNLYFLLGFSLVFAASYLVLRTFGMSLTFAFVGGVLYTFSAFHFGRIVHLFFTWYFVAPLFFYFGFKLFNANADFFGKSKSIKSKCAIALSLVILASFGIYYAAFGCLVLGICTILSSLMYRSWRHFRGGFIACSIIIVGVLLNIFPSLLYLVAMGSNVEGVNRSPAESELYGLKLTQMLLPRGDHRLVSFYEFTNQYTHYFSNTSESVSASLGLAGSVGFLLLLASIFFTPMGLNSNFKNRQDKQFLYQMLIMSQLVCILFLITTVGGFSSLFSLLISSSIRSWNRISIFIAFISIAALMLSLDWIFKKYLKNTKSHYVLVAEILLAIILIFYGVRDQTVKPCLACLNSNAISFANDKAFVQTIERSLKPHSAIYQLPYMAYPESDAVNNLSAYGQARGHIHSETLKWSFGGIRGREGDWFYRKLAQLSVEQQLVVAKALGFSGVYIDRRGYLGERTEKRCRLNEDSKMSRLKANCLTVAEIEQDISSVLSESFKFHIADKIISNDKQLSFYPLQSNDDSESSKKENLALANQYILPIGFEIVNGIPVAAGSFEESVDFKTAEFPAFVMGVTGLSEVSENLAAPVNSEMRFTGRWSDANIAPVVKLWLAKPLPIKFNLTITARGGGPNADKPLQIKIGKQVKELIFGADMQTKTVAFELDGKFQIIEFKPYQPFVPARRWLGASDVRKLGVEFEKVLISVK